MSVLINASTSSGIGLTPDNSGVIQFQSNGTNTTSIAANGTLTSSNLTTTGSVTATGTVTAGNVTISSGGSITFPDATTQSTAAVSGAWVKVATTNVTSSVATVDFTNLGSYRALRVSFSDVRPSSDGAELSLRVSSDNGSTYISTNTYAYGTNVTTSLATSAASVFISSPDSKGIGNAATDGGTAGVTHIFDFNVAQKTKFWTTGVGFEGSAIPIATQNFYSGFQSGQTAMNAIRFLLSSGNVAQGVFVVEGWTGS